MIPFPTGMRMATIGDEDRIYALFVVAHAENGYGTMDPIVVKAMIHRGCRGESIVIALIDGPERIEAAIALTPEKRWYASDAQENWHNTDLLLYVHPLHRRSRHAVKLFQFGKWWAEESKMPTILGVFAKDDMERKEALFSRYGKRVASSYEVGGGDVWPSEAVSE